MNRHRLGFFNQLSRLAVVALVVTLLLAILDFRDRSNVNRILTEQQMLLLLKKKLTQATQDLLKARLNESQLINTKKVVSFEKFEAALAQTESLISILTARSQDVDIIEPLNTTQIHLEKYQASVVNIRSLQREMGLDNADGILPQLQTSNQSIETLLIQAGQKDLIFNFVQMQIFEKDFSSTLDMRLTNQLNEQIEELDLAIQSANLSSNLKGTLLQEIDAYQKLVSEFIFNTIELELSIAESTLHYDRIAPNITLSQEKIDQLLEQTSEQLRSQRRSSTIQTIAVFSSAFTVLVCLVILQLRNARQLTKRLQQLARGMQEVATGQFEEIGELPQGNDEVGTLADTFSSMATQIQRQIAVIKKAQERAEIANQAKSNFLANMSHELRTPLNAILGFTQMMQQQQGLASEHYDHLSIINQSGKRLLALINEVLDMSKIEAGKATLNEEVFDIHKLLETIKAMLQMNASAKGLELIVDCAPEVPQWIQTDQQKLYQVLINLLGNALKFTQEGYVSLKVSLADAVVGELSVCEPEDKPESTESEAETTSPIQILAFSITDSGPGIAPDELQTLFDSFSQGQQGKEQGGTGLGLAISRSFVQLMKGDIRVQSQLGQGSQFRFELPIGVVSPTNPTVVKPLAAITLAANQPDYRVLVVENNQSSQNMVQLLTGVGFSVQTINNGKDAFELCKQWYPHLIWMNVNMPITDGCEATRQIKQWATAQSPIQWGAPLQSPVALSQAFPIVIALSSTMVESERQQMVAAGCSDFIRKPLQRGLILQKIEDYLGVQYCYEDTIAAHPTFQERSPIVLTSNKFTSAKLATVDIASPNGHVADLSPDMLRTMPLEWVKQLHQDACLADQDSITDLVNNIMTVNSSLGLAIQRLVNQFDYGKIVACTEQVLNHE